MGKRSDLTVSQRREVVLMLLRREERRFGAYALSLAGRLPGRRRGGFGIGQGAA